MEDGRLDIEGKGRLRIGFPSPIFYLPYPIFRPPGRPLLHLTICIGSFTIQA